MRLAEARMEETANAYKFYAEYLSGKSILGDLSRVMLKIKCKDIRVQCEVAELIELSQGGKQLRGFYIHS
jgi:hypothetical protein